MGEVFTKRNLPHWYVPGAQHFVTYRLAGTIPQSALHTWREERLRRMQTARDAGAAEGIERAHKLFFARYDEYLDLYAHADELKRPTVAAMIRENLYHHDGEKYHLISYCIMPNHVHVLLQPLEPQQVQRSFAWMPDEAPDGNGPLASIMHSLKSYTANRANELLGRTGQFWQHESYDHWVRDDAELERIMYYINGNPVKAKLATRPCDWWFSSAHDRFLQDGFENGALLPRNRR